MLKTGIIGGSGLEKLNFFDRVEEIQADTPYGKPSSVIFKGVTGKQEVFILSRHDRDHSIPPTQVNYRANISCLKMLGCQRILATTACGSLREEIRMGDLVFPDQFIDFTYRRINTFHDRFSPEITGHVAMPEPFSGTLRDLLCEGASELEYSFHPSGTVITIEGPRFSTRAESRMYRTLGADIVNMSIAPEAALANEAGIPYGVVALSTDYDAWRTDHDPVTWDTILANFEMNVKKVTQLLVWVIKKLEQ